MVCNCLLRITTKREFYYENHYVTCNMKLFEMTKMASLSVVGVASSFYYFFYFFYFYEANEALKHALCTQQRLENEKKLQFDARKCKKINSFFVTVEKNEGIEKTRIKLMMTSKK